MAHQIAGIILSQGLRDFSPNKTGWVFLGNVHYLTLPYTLPATRNNQAISRTGGTRYQIPTRRPERATPCTGPAARRAAMIGQQYAHRAWAKGKPGPAGLMLRSFSTASPPAAD